MQSISLHFKDKGMLVRLEADSALAVKSFVLTSPDRLVIDLPGSWKGLKTPEIPSNTLVKGVRIGRHGGADRIVFDLTRPLKSQTMTKTANNTAEVVFE
jgi:N-acetylmuramoyl-L-alanine amidase